MGRVAALDSEGHPLRVVIPAPATLADDLGALLIDEDVEAFRTRGSATLYARRSNSDVESTPVHLLDTAARLVERLAALPTPTARQSGGVLDNLRLLASASPGHARGYTVDALRALRPRLPYLSSASNDDDERERRPAMSPTQRKAAKPCMAPCTRDRVGSGMDCWLAFGMGRSRLPPAPGSRIVARDLYEQAVEAINEWVESDEPVDDDDSSLTARIPTLQRFYPVADAILGARHRVNGQRVYAVPSRLRLEQSHFLRADTSRLQRGHL